MLTYLHFNISNTCIKYTCHVPSRVQCPPFAVTRLRYQTRAGPPSTHHGGGPGIYPHCHPPFRPIQSPGPRFPRQIARGRFEKKVYHVCVYVLEGADVAYRRYGVYMV